MVKGIDLSLTGTGCIKLDNGKVVESEVIKSSPSGHNPKAEISRLLTIKRKINLDGVRLVVIEGLAFMSHKTQSIAQLAALNYLVREELYYNDIPFIIVAPSTLKKFVTGKGNSQKDLMMLETYKRFGQYFTNNNLCDAFGLAMLGEAVLGRNKEPLAKYQQEAVNVVKNQIL